MIKKKIHLTTITSCYACEKKGNGFEVCTSYVCKSVPLAIALGQTIGWILTNEELLDSSKLRVKKNMAAVISHFEFTTNLKGINNFAHSPIGTIRLIDEI